ncbi:hypothetical protein [Bacillus altitudinis]|uniref:hypothetical protein n=1 Tax=Bacillus altitudinis TaxID=293387 RepID=UPI000542F130|nr:hypothetical protein [Bacillus altitudinis]KWZ65249.1 hypothetical protein HQ51_0214385 [Bacillus altitudinis]
MKRLEHLFMHSEKEFRSYQSLVENVFYQNEHLPQQVFQKNFDCFLFQEFDWALSDEVLTTIKKLSVLTQDKDFLTAVLKPDPVEYYMKEFGYYNWLRTSVDISGDDYVNALWTSPESSIADAIITNSNIVVWLSHSLEWAIWGDRELEICILGLASKKAPKTILEEGWKPLDHPSLTDWLELLLNDKKKVNDYVTQFATHYSSKGA